MFVTPAWDDNNVPVTKFTFHQKNNRKQKNRDKVNLPSLASTFAFLSPTSSALTATTNTKATAPAATDNEPGKYVRINTNRAISLIDDSSLKRKKRKIKQGSNDAGWGGHEKSAAILPMKRQRKKLFIHSVSTGEKDNNGDGSVGGRSGGTKRYPKHSAHQKDGDENKRHLTDGIPPTTTTSSNKGDGDLCDSKELKLKRKFYGNTLVIEQHQKHRLPPKNNQNNSKDTNDNIQKNDSTKKSYNTLTTNKLKSFREQLTENLKGSRFRYLNEQLYTANGNQAVKIFREEPSAFSAYHDGYRQQVKQWPLNPLDRIIKAINKLPKNFIIADFGCGEGRLAKCVFQKTYSLDVVAANDSIIACDMAQTPLTTNSINVVVFCLSLMGTNLKDFFLEANRVMKMGGQIKMAEVESRFDDIKKFIENVQKCGFQIENKDLSNNLFYFMNFKKIRSVTKIKNKIPDFSLKPCLYKKR